MQEQVIIGTAETRAEWEAERASADRAELKASAEYFVAKLLTYSICFNVAVLVMLLSILLDLSGNTYERVRLGTELLAVIGAGGFAIWLGVFRRGRI